MISFLVHIFSLSLVIYFKRPFLSAFFYVIFLLACIFQPILHSYRPYFPIFFDHIFFKLFLRPFLFSNNFQSLSAYRIKYFQVIEWLLQFFLSAIFLTILVRHIFQSLSSCFFKISLSSCNHFFD